MVIFITDSHKWRQIVDHKISHLTRIFSSKLISLYFMLNNKQERKSLVRRERFEFAFLSFFRQYLFIDFFLDFGGIQFFLVNDK